MDNRDISLYIEASEHKVLPKNYFKPVNNLFSVEKDIIMTNRLFEEILFYYRNPNYDSENIESILDLLSRRYNQIIHIYYLKIKSYNYIGNRILQSINCVICGVDATKKARLFHAIAVEKLLQAVV